MDKMNDIVLPLAHQTTFSNQTGEFTLIQISEPHCPFGVDVIEFHKFSCYGQKVKRAKPEILDVNRIDDVRAALNSHISDTEEFKRAHKYDKKIVWNESMWSESLRHFVRLDVTPAEMTISVYSKINTGKMKDAYYCTFHLALPYTKDMDSCSWLESSLFSIAQKQKSVET